MQRLQAWDDRWHESGGIRKDAFLLDERKLGAVFRPRHDDIATAAPGRTQPLLTDKPMHSRFSKTLALAAAFAGAPLASADVSLNSVRVVAKDAETLGKFYAAAFGMHETNRLQTQGGPELFLNF